MTKSKHLFMSLLAVLLSLALLPLTAMALRENELEPAPEITLPEEDITDTGAETPEGNNQADYAYRPEPVELPQRGTLEESEELNLPRLTDAELALVQELLAAKEAGEQPDFDDRHYASAEEVFEAGVYPLDPGQFDGNTFFVILPYFQMNRDQLLSLISAFEELGIPFDPESLNNTNCVRGTPLLYSNAGTRALSAEEKERMNRIQEQIRSDVFDRDTFTASDACRTVQVQMPGYSGSAYDYLEPFSFYPYRAMTDNELATFALAQEITWEVHPDRLEKKARQYAHKCFPLPLSMSADQESRYAYSPDHIEFRNTFTIGADNCDGLYASPDETPDEVMVEQVLYRENGILPEEPYLACILIDYPALYSEKTGDQSECSEDDLKAAARRWTERYLLVPAEDILTDWVFDMRSEAWGSVQYRLLTTEWLVTLEMSAHDAAYFQCCIYNRDHAVEYDDWFQDAPGESAGSETAATDTQASGIDSYTVDKSARQELMGLLNLPLNMITNNITRLNDAYIQYMCDYSFPADNHAGNSLPPEMTPSGMTVYQTPHFSQAARLRVESVFITYSFEDAGHVRLSDEEFLSAARKWAEQTLLIPEEQILADWVRDPESSEEGTVVYRLQAAGWTVYLQMYPSGAYCWSGIYRRNSAE